MAPTQNVASRGNPSGRTGGLVIENNGPCYGQVSNATLWVNDGHRRNLLRCARLVNLLHCATGRERSLGAILLRDGIKCRLVAFHCRKSFAACCLPRHSGFLSFVFWPVGNDRTDELVQKVYRVAHGL